MKKRQSVRKWKFALTAMLVLPLLKERLTEMIAEGRIVPGTNADLAQTPAGVPVRRSRILVRWPRSNRR